LTPLDVRELDAEVRAVLSELADKTAVELGHHVDAMITSTIRGKV
jgi:hypothetical protein